MGGAAGEKAKGDKLYKPKFDEIKNSEFLTEEEKQTWTKDLQSIRDKWIGIRKDKGTYGLGPNSWNERLQAESYQAKLADVKKENAARRVFIKEQFDTLTQGVNSRLQQTRLTSFLGATAARNAL